MRPKLNQPPGFAKNNWESDGKTVLRVMEIAKKFGLETLLLLWEASSTNVWIATAMPNLSARQKQRRALLSDAPEISFSPNSANLSGRLH